MSAFVCCEGLAFRLVDVDGFHHEPAPDPETEPETTVFFKSYTASVPDPERHLYNFLTESTRPHVH